MEVKKGDSVTLDPGLTKPFNHIQWRFGGSIIAETDGNEASYTKDERFRGRLKLNNKTGSLTFNNMRITDTGLYHLEINHNTVISNKTFSVTVQEFEVKMVSVMEGDSVTLDTGLTEKFDRIKWRFGGSDSIIAETDSNEISYPLNDTERFRDRLKLNNQTGSLTFNNTRITDSGLYHLWIDHSAGTSTVTFIVTVNDPGLSPGSFDPDPGLSLGALAAIVVAPLVVSAATAAVSAAISYCRKISKRRRQNDKEKRKSTDSGQSDL